MCRNGSPVALRRAKIKAQHISERRASPCSFERFLLDYHADDPVGDLAADFRRVLQKNPELGSEYISDEELLEHFEDRGVGDVARRAWKKYRAARSRAART